MNINDRVKREKESHENEDVLYESIKLKNRFSHITKYPGFLNMEKRFKNFYENSNDKIVLDYGCGKGLDSLKLLKSGSFVYGIDIAENYINESIELAKKNGFKEDKFNFQVMDAHNLTFKDNMFDLVIGNGILHHLDKFVAIKSIYRVLKPGGRLVFKEPLGDNPLLKVFRYLTPKARTIDEEPFSKKDLDKIVDPSLWKTENMFFCGSINSFLAVLTSLIIPNSPQNKLLDFGNYLEKKINKIKYFQSWNQYVLFNLIKR